MNEYEEIRNYCLNCITKPCKEKGCPLQNDIPAFIHENDIKKLLKNYVVQQYFLQFVEEYVHIVSNVKAVA